MFFSFQRTKKIRLNSSQNGGHGLLGLEVGVEEKGGLVGEPAVGVTAAPAGDTDTVLDVNAALGDGNVVRLRGAGDVELGDGNLGGAFTENLESSGVGGTRASEQVRLGTDAVDGNAFGNPLLDILAHG